MRKLFLTLLLSAAGFCCFAQSTIVTNSGEAIKGYNVDCSASNAIYYQLSDSTSNQFLMIPKKDVAVIRLENGTIYNPSETVNKEDKKTEEPSKFPNIDLTDYHGFLLAKGNCVYVAPNSDENYDKWGVERIKLNMKRIGYWTVVDKPEQAHFIMQFGVCLVGEDMGIIYLRTRKSVEELPYFVYSTNALGGIKVSEPESACMMVTRAGEEKDKVYRGIDDWFSGSKWGWGYFEKRISDPNKLKDKDDLKKYFFLP